MTWPLSPRKAAGLGWVGFHDLRHFFLGGDVDHRQRNRAAGRAHDQMHLVLVDEAVDVRDTLVGLALVVEQDDLDLLAVDTARGIDGFELVLRHLAILKAVLHDHAQRDSDADNTVLRLRRLRHGTER
jgi:hypothetical protein